MRLYTKVDKFSKYNHKNQSDFISRIYLVLIVCWAISHSELEGGKVGFVGVTKAENNSCIEDKERV